MWSVRSHVVVHGMVVATAAALLGSCTGDGGNETRGRSTTTTSTLATATTATTVACALTGATTDAKMTAASAGVALLTNARTGRQRCADRIVFDFREGTPPPGFTIEYRPGPTFALGESDQTVTVAGRAFLVARFERAAGVDLSKPTAPPTYRGPASIRPTGLTHVTEIRRIQDFEGVLVWVIGLDSMRPFSVGTLTGGPRVYLDIG